MTHPSITRSRSALAASAVAALFLLSGCASETASSTETTTGAATEQPAADAAGGQGAPGGMGGGGVSGTIAAISGAILQVQSTDEQTAVTYTADTAITQAVSAALEQVTIGSCVVASATTVAISAAVDGGCTAGFGGGLAPGSGGGDAPTDLPSEMPTDLPTDMPTGAGGFGDRTAGLVTAVSGTTITVDVTGPDGATTSATTSATVEVSADTAYTTSVAADPAAIVVGLCASARGETDDSGQMTATSLTLSSAGDDGCSAAMNARGGMRGGAPAGARSDG